MTTRERLHKLVDELPEKAAVEAFALISDLAEPDDGRLDAKEIEALQEADAAIAAGEVRPFAEARRELGLGARRSSSSSPGPRSATSGGSIHRSPTPRRSD